MPDDRRSAHPLTQILTPEEQRLIPGIAVRTVVTMALLLVVAVLVVVTVTAALPLGVPLGCLVPLGVAAAVHASRVRLFRRLQRSVAGRYGVSTAASRTLTFSNEARFEASLLRARELDARTVVVR